MIRTLSFVNRSAWSGVSCLSKRSLGTSPPLCESDEVHKRRERLKKKCATQQVDYIPEMCAIDPSTPQPCVIIIGAGCAGLSAANRLLQSGISNFKILEATDKAGGRIKSMWFGDVVAELGAEFIYGAQVTNNIFTLAVQEQLLKAPLLRQPCNEELFLTKDSRPLAENLVRKGTARFDLILSKAFGMFEREAECACSLGEFFDAEVERMLPSIPEEERYDTIKVIYGLAGALRSRIGASIYNVSSKYYGVQRELPGGCIRVQLGMSAVLAPLLRDLPENSVQYCKPVQTVRWGAAGVPGDPRAVVRCYDGSEYAADYVIVSVPLGVLKNSSDSLFCPTLPASKRSAIDNLGFGNITKVFFMYDKPFWGGDDFKFSLGLLPDDLKDDDSWANAVTHAGPVPRSNKVFGFTLIGQAAKAAEQTPENEVMETLVRILGSTLGDRGMPAPKTLIRSNWCSDIFTGGGVTYISNNSNTGHIKDLSLPLPGDCDDVPPILLFCGEHTSREYHGTLHGARRTGIREADRIVELTKKLRGLPIKQPATLSICSS